MLEEASKLGVHTCCTFLSIACDLQLLVSSVYFFPRFTNLCALNFYSSRPYPNIFIIFSSHRCATRCSGSRLPPWPAKARARSTTRTKSATARPLLPSFATAPRCSATTTSVTWSEKSASRCRLRAPLCASCGAANASGNWAKKTKEGRAARGQARDRNDELGADLSAQVLFPLNDEKERARNQQQITSPDSRIKR